MPESIRQRPEPVPIALACVLRTASFSDELVFTVVLANGRTYESLAPRAACWDMESRMILSDEPLGETNGYVEATALDFVDDQLIVEIPDGTTIVVMIASVSARPSRTVPSRFTGDRLAVQVSRQQRFEVVMNEPFPGERPENAEVVEFSQRFPEPFTPLEAATVVEEMARETFGLTAFRGNVMRASDTFIPLTNQRGIVNPESRSAQSGQDYPRISFDEAVRVPTSGELGLQPLDQEIIDAISISPEELVRRAGEINLAEDFGTLSGTWNYHVADNETNL